MCKKNEMLNFLFSVNDSEIIPTLTLRSDSPDYSDFCSDNENDED